MLSKRQRRLAAKQERRISSPTFFPVDLSVATKVPPGMTRAFRNNLFMVMIWDDRQTTKGPAIQALIQQHDDRPIEKHWATIQKIKNELFGSETTAIEFYPAESELVNHHNIYWIWIFPEGVLPKPL